MPQLLKIACLYLYQAEVLIFKNTHQLDIQQLCGSKQLRGDGKPAAPIRRLIILFAASSFMGLGHEKKFDKKDESKPKEGTGQVFKFFRGSLKFR
jgi:hypothetical protein